MPDSEQGIAVTLKGVLDELDAISEDHRELYDTAMRECHG